MSSTSNSTSLVNPSSPIFRNPIIHHYSSSLSLVNPTSLRPFPIKSNPKLSPPRLPLIRASLSPGTNNDREPTPIEEEEEETRQVVYQILREAGVSEEESADIASKSTQYVNTLIESVGDLDQLSLWKSWTSSNVEDLSFRNKVLFMAKQKGDNGLLPFLESIGLNPSSSTHIARYLVSEPLPHLIHKVKYLKDLVYPGAENNEYIGKNARRMMTQLSVFAEEDVQQTLSFFEKMEARRGGLSMLGSRDASFHFLIESFPRLLLLSEENHLVPLVEFLKGVGVPKERIGVILLLFPPFMFYDTELDLKPRLRAFEHVGVKEKDIGRMLLKYPWILSASIQGNIKNIISFFEIEKVPKVSVDRAIKSWPHILGCSINKMKIMVEQLGELGIKSKKLGKVIASSPQLLLRRPDEVFQVISFMEGLGLDKMSIERILSRCPEIFAGSIENTLKKKVKLLVDNGISEAHIPRVIQKYPELLVSDVSNTILPRMEFLVESGLSKREVASMVRRFSPLLGYSIKEVLKPKLEFLMNTMEKPVKDVVDYPRYFSYSLEKKIKPRFWVLKGRNVESSLKDMLGKNDEDFATDYMGIGRMLVPLPRTDNRP